MTPAEGRCGGVALEAAAGLPRVEYLSLMDLMKSSLLLRALA